MIRNIGLILCVAFMISGCVSVQNVKNDFSLNSDSNKGLLLASITYSGSYSGYSMKFRKIGAEKFESIQIGSGTALLPPGMLDWDISRSGLRGNVFAIELPVGEYEFSS